MKNQLNILEAYLDQILNEGGTRGIHSDWFYGAEQQQIDTLATFARAPDGFNTPETAQQKVESAPEWRGFATDQGDGAGGEHKVYWKPLGGKVYSATASKLLAAIAQWKPSEAPTEDQFKAEGEAAPAQQAFDAEQEAIAQEDAAIAQAEAEDRQSNPEQIERMTTNLEQLGISFKAKRTKLGATEEYEMTAEEVANAIDEACKVPPKNSYLHDILEYTRGAENKYGWAGDVNQELVDAYDEILQVAPSIQEDDDGRYVLEEDLSERQKDILDAARCRKDGLYLGWNRNGESGKAFPKLEDAMTEVVKARDAVGRPVNRAFSQYGVSNKNTKHICEALAGVKIRSKDGSESPLLKSSGTGKKGENNLVGTFSEAAFVGIIEFLNGRGEDQDTLSKGVIDFATALQKVDKSVRANEQLWEGIVPSMTTEEESELCDWYQRMERMYGIYGSPNELTKALFMQRAQNLKTIIEVGGVAPVGAWEPSKDEERGNDKTLGVKRDIVFNFASESDAQKFAIGIGLSKEYAHGTEVDISLKTLESMNKGVNFEGATHDVAMGLSPVEAKREQYEDNFNNRVEYIKRTNKALGAKIADNMIQARDWEREVNGKIQQALSQNNSDMLPALESIVDRYGDTNTSVAGGAKALQDLNKLKQKIKDLSNSTGAERATHAAYISRNLLSLLKYQRAKSNKNYAQGAALHDVINTMSSKESEAVVILNNDRMSSFAGDRIMDDAIAAVVEGRAEPQELGGYSFRDEQGNKMFKSSYAVDKRGFIRVRGTIEGSYFQRHSKQLS